MRKIKPVTSDIWLGNKEHSRRILQSPLWFQPRSHPDKSIDGMRKDPSFSSMPVARPYPYLKWHFLLAFWRVGSIVLRIMPLLIFKRDDDDERRHQATILPIWKCDHEHGDNLWRTKETIKEMARASTCLLIQWTLWWGNSSPPTLWWGFVLPNALQQHIQTWDERIRAG